MKRKLIYSLLVCSTLAFSPFAFSATDQSSNNDQQQSMQAKSNGEVIAWISAIDNFEINASQIASNKKLDDSVKDYSTMLYNDHSKNLKEAGDLSSQIGEQPVETKALTKFQDHGKKELSKLDKQDKNFQKVFIEKMIAGHKDALSKVDHELMKKASNDNVKSFLQQTRDMIAHHLETAKTIQKNMKSES